MRRTWDGVRLTRAISDAANKPERPMKINSKNKCGTIPLSKKEYPKKVKEFLFFIGAFGS